VLLPAFLVPRRADSAHVILGALLAKAGGRGHRSIAAEVCVPAGTVRGWLRRANANAEKTRGEATCLAVQLDPLLGPIAPIGSPLGEALNAVGIAVVVARLRLAVSVGSPSALAMIIGKSLLNPLREHDDDSVRMTDQFGVHGDAVLVMVSPSSSSRASANTRRADTRNA
jgi:hypothetical protein